MSNEKLYCVYLATNKNNSVIYTGVTNNLIRHMDEHRSQTAEGFTKRYKINKLVYYEATASIYSAIEREKQLKGGSRKRKIQLIESVNPLWQDLCAEIASSSNSSQ